MSRRRDTDDDLADCSDLDGDDAGDTDRVGRADDAIFSEDDDGDGDGSITRPRIDRSV